MNTAESLLSDSLLFDDSFSKLLGKAEYEIPEHIQDFINFEDYGKYIGDCVEECNDGLIEIYR